MDPANTATRPPPPPIHRLRMTPNMPPFNSQKARTKMRAIGNWITKDEVVALRETGLTNMVEREQLRMNKNAALNARYAELHTLMQQAIANNNTRRIRELTFQRKIINMAIGICNGVYSDNVIYQILIYGIMAATFFTVENVANARIDVPDMVDIHIRSIETLIDNTMHHTEISQADKDEVRLLGNQVIDLLLYYNELFLIERAVRQIEFKTRSYSGMTEAEHATLRQALSNLINGVQEYVNVFNAYPYTQQEPYYTRFLNVLRDSQAALNLLEERRIPTLEEYITPLENGAPDTTLTADTQGFNIIGHYEEPVLEFLNEDPANNIAFKTGGGGGGGTYSLLSRSELNTILANKNAYVRHKCRELDIVNTQNVDPVPYVSLRALGMPGGIVLLGLLRSILLNRNIHIVEVVRIGPPANTASLVSHHIMTTRNPNYFSAAHCQEGQLEDEYTLLNITPPPEITHAGGARRTRRRRRHYRKRHRRSRHVRTKYKY